MANAKYTQVTTLLAQGRLNWTANDIRAALVKNGTFNAAHQTLSQVGTALQSVPVPGRTVGENGALLGQPVFFGDVAEDQSFQVVIVQNLNNGDPNVLAWYDTDDQGNPIRLQNPGTLVIRPTVDVDHVEPLAEVIPTNVRIWMQV